MQLHKIFTLAALIFSSGAVSGQATYTNAMGIKFHQIQGGISFNMGKATAYPNGVFWDSAPQHKVTISQNYYMATAEVTNAQFERFQPSHIRSTNKAVSGDNEPAVNISWEQAEKFIAWLNKNYPPAQPGMVYRLPTEAEWEYAADNAGKLALDMMQSGAEEWTSDWYGPYTGNAQTDPVGSAKGVFRVSRGNDYNAYPGYSDPTVRMGSLPWDINPCIGFRLIIGQKLKTPYMTSADEKPEWAKNVSQTEADFQLQVPSTMPYFSTPQQYFTLPSPLRGPFYSHDHEPAITYCPNGDLLAIFFSCVSETGREMTVLSCRLRKGAKTWDKPALFYDTPSRNETGAGLFNDNGTLYHFQSFGADGNYDNLANCFQTSTDNGVNWSTPRPINTTHGFRNQVISGFRTASGRLIVACDATPANGGGTAIHYSDDNGLTWTDRGANLPTPAFVQGGTGHMIAGIHAAVIETIRNGVHIIIAYGRQDNINGMMPQSLSTDNGITWRYSASPFPAISGGQRAICKQLSSGALLLVSFATNGMAFSNKGGKSYNGSGMFAALSYDGGQTWPIMKLLTDGATRSLKGYGNTGDFTTGPYNAEPAGYLAGVQTPDGIIHVVSSGVYYSFNQAWLQTPYELPKAASTVTVKNGKFESPVVTASPSQIIAPSGWIIANTAGVMNPAKNTDGPISGSTGAGSSAQCAFLSTINAGTIVNVISQPLSDDKLQPVDLAAGQCYVLQFYIARRNLPTTATNITTGSGAVLSYGIRDVVTRKVIASGSFDTGTIAKAAWIKVNAVLNTGNTPISGNQAELFFSKNIGGQVLISNISIEPDFSECVH
ncbi:Formylglycine-generating enzyme, required for sulfatase activity, contains SUMF1/FGE domain [Mucilaginibacter mallensis]|uniref:Formylglycine-generating enzyme, required for sulfatase activity, contains SUMF1/FGE domain n=1 Tax=Mucilaginibacter mallensis TaxID=652787 RepID=A0A1H1W3Z3_MUCMA|nr:SUMF1/EgtB/PvdO family nonheme iron enzyme [Mucilaginibacter mallensis]SDS91794.1 Formylglycine-generating enzyme, required for sulfatase activity, contains SUMF1/FGE domain [Mucilaginibacter mallensis]